jgi:hypothetical protein
MSRKIQLAVFCAMVVSSFLLHVFLFGEAGYFTRQRLQDRLQAIRGQIEELDRENSRLAEQYAALEEAGAGAPVDSSGATILTFESTYETGEDLSRQMEQQLANPETIFFVLVSLATASALLVVRLFPRRV